MAIIFGPDAFTIASTVNVDIDDYPSTASPDYAYLAGAANDMYVDATNDYARSSTVSGEEHTAECIAISSTLGDQEIRGVVQMGNGHADDESGGFVRTNDTGGADFHGYQGYLINRASELEINKHTSTGGSNTLVSADRGLAVSTPYTFAFRIRGSELRMIVNGETALTSTDTGFPTGRPGIHIINPGAGGAGTISWFDDYEVDDLTTGIWNLGVGAQVSAGGSTSITPVIPSGSTTDDFGVIFVTGKPTSTVLMSAPTGWTEDTNARVLAERGARDLRAQVFYKKLAGGDGNPVCHIPSNWQHGTQGGATAQIITYRGVSTSSPLDANSVTSKSTAAAATFQPTGITTATAKAQVVGLVGTDDDNALRCSTPRNFTAWMGGASFDTVDGGDFSVGVASRQGPSTAAAVTMPTWTQTVNGNDGWVGVAMALKPATAGQTITPAADTAAWANQVPATTLGAVTKTPAAVNSAWAVQAPTSDPGIEQKAVGITDITIKFT